MSLKPLMKRRQHRRNLQNLEDGSIIFLARQRHAYVYFGGSHGSHGMLLASKYDLSAVLSPTHYEMQKLSTVAVGRSGRVNGVQGSHWPASAAINGTVVAQWGRFP